MDGPSKVSCFSAFRGAQGFVEAARLVLAAVVRAVSLFSSVVVADQCLYWHGNATHSQGSAVPWQPV